MTSAAQPYRAEQLAQACNLGTSTLFEASGLSTSATDVAIRPVWAGAAVAGPAYPLECSPGDNLAIHIAMEKAPRGSILVISTGGFVAGYWGEVLTVAAEAAGVAGLVIDGGVRDVAALTARRFPVIWWWPMMMACSSFPRYMSPTRWLKGKPVRTRKPG